MHYDKYKKNQFSQNGEDGVLEQLIKELNLDINGLWVVDVGAYDGVAYSNFYKLIQQGANAVLIEGSRVGGAGEAKYDKLKDLPNSFPKVKTFNHFAKLDSQYQKSIEAFEHCRTHHANFNLEYNAELKSLDETLKEVDNFPTDYDILNIDIDSYDHEIWKEHLLNPKIVIIEVTSSLPPTETDKTNGYSFMDSLNLGMSNGYSCVCHTGNMIFVRNDLLDELSIPKELINSKLLFNTSWYNGPL